VRFQTTPDKFGFPVRRQRIFVFGIHSTFADQNQLDKAHIILKQMESSDRLISVDDLLLPDFHDVLSKKSMTKRKYSAFGKWNTQCLDLALRRPIMTNHKTSVDHIQSSCLLLPRERETLEEHTLAGTIFTHIDLSQRPDRCARGHMILPCVTPGARIWDTRHNRFLCGREKLHAQGIWPKQPVSPTNDSLESDLAGNAFNTISFCCVLVSILCAVGRAHFEAENKCNCQAFFKKLYV